MLSLRFISDRRLLSKNMRKLNWKNERRGKATLLDCVTLILFCRVVWLSFFFRHFFQWYGWKSIANCVATTHTSPLTNLVETTLTGWSIIFPLPSNVLLTVCFFTEFFKFNLYLTHLYLRWYILIHNFIYFESCFYLSGNHTFRW